MTIGMCLTTPSTGSWDSAGWFWSDMRETSLITAAYFS
jgi:hypothetical protein